MTPTAQEKSVAATKLLDYPKGGAASGEISQRSKFLNGKVGLLSLFFGALMAAYFMTHSTKSAWVDACVIDANSTPLLAAHGKGVIDKYCGCVYATIQEQAPFEFKEFTEGRAEFINPNTAGIGMSSPYLNPKSVKLTMVLIKAEGTCFKRNVGKGVE